MKFVKSLLIGIAAAAIGAAAFAADAPATKARASIEPVYNWTGPWIGVDLGYDFKSNGVDVTGADKFSSKILSSGAFPSRVGVPVDGGQVRFQVGYDWQFAPQLVARVMGGYAYSAMRGAGSAGGNLIGVQFDEKIRNIWNVFGGLGWAPTRDDMFSVVGGWTHATVDTTISTSGLACAFGLSCLPGATSSGRDGWSLGSEYEHRFGKNMSVKLMYLYTDLGTQTTPVTLGAGKFATTFNNAESVQYQTISVGVNYRY